jgi:hypothetical protein
LSGRSAQNVRDTPDRGGRSLSRVRNPDSSGFSLLEERQARGDPASGAHRKKVHRAALRKRAETPWRDRKSASV